ncbi:flippase [Salinadaptatus halalkaliphilus]|uniref:Flippase n=1 Tax=Salinadaptatus halalkaliphilus TaxID=2419781 RepID=A0A4S3TM32_9EURY|nr:flippase [Salinadaptatus halalkaliphilus]THE65146.1 flippase [Salinadaptatus halalkaliphilus]
MPPTRSILSRFKTELLGQLVAAVSGALLLVGLARFLEPDAYGLLFFSISIFTILMVLTKLGIARSAGRYLSEYKETDPSQIPHIVRTSLLLNAITITIGAVGLLIGHQLLAEFVDEPDLAPFLLLGVLYVVFGTLTKYVRLVLQGFEAIESAAVVHGINRGGRLVFSIGLVLASYGAVGALGGYILGYVVATVIGFVLVYTRHYRPRVTDEPPEPGLRRRLAEYTVPLTATSTATVIEKQVDTVLIGFFLTPVAVGYYTISKQAIEFLEKPMTALGFTLSPTFGAEKADGNLEHARDLFEVAVTNSLLIYVPAAAGLVLVSDPMIRFVFGPDYVGAVPVLQIFSAYIVLRAIMNIAGHALDFLGRARDRAIAKGLTATLNFGLNVALIPVIGIAGAAITTVLTHGIYTVFNVYLIHVELELRLVALLSTLTRIVAITGVMSVVVFVSLEFITGLFTLLLVVGVGVAVWAVLSVLVGLVDPDDAVSVVTG